ncbi:SDR family NAD(P)-dependent oxidoreductase [Actinocorallia sp. A-T 12471]|uniref:SDR family NAD(P)-dependent oxidoreductase n=1 Tax=Actinocorallia sp. A-T 12471 TaxID=3089813 RepID=UPI0029CC425C|nr:SDR family oxidoreductase [Actinocorallia sp. A-T 12471]MDX6740906.1 SDR family oxidoreductase [Actinocorallia sp. A-T 12471]
MSGVGRLSADLTGRTAVVTGASSGLGMRFAELLAGSGATVFAAARRKDRLESLAERVPGVVPVTCDVTDDAARQALFETVMTRDGKIDLLVNNAGHGVSKPALEETVESFERVVALNLTATFALSTLFARPMIEAGAGSIVNIASILGLVAAHPTSQVSYTAAKGAVVNMTRELGVQWASRGVRVNAIAPGWFPTEVTEEFFADERGSAWLRRNTPMGRTGRPDELDGVMLLLASDASTFITGQTLVVDGGWTAR